MNIEYLRAKALAYAPTFRLPLCLDDRLRADVDAAVSELAKAQNALAALASVPAEQKRAKSIAAKSPTKAAEDAVAAAEAALQAAEDAAAGDVIVLVWRRLDPDAYDDLMRAHMTGGRLDLVRFYPALIEACWHRAESADGQDVGLSWLEARGLLNNADRDAAQVGVLNLNRAPSDIPFSPRNSGVPATSSEPA